MSHWEEIRARARARHAACAPADDTADALLIAAEKATGLPYYALPATDPALYGAQGVYDAECRLILVSNALPPAYRAFVVAHEFAHHWLGHGSAVSSAGGPDPEAGDDPHGGDPARVEGYSPFERAERVANVFACEFLLPTDALRRHYRDAGESPARIAALVGVPEGMVLRQLSRALLLPPPVDVPDTPIPPLTTRDAREKLDDSQRAAAHALRGPVFVEAGPGTGKTRALVGRIVHLLEKGESSEGILALTFSNRAAEEMRGRVAAIAPDAAPRLWIGTFHAFALELLRRWGGRVGLPPGFAVRDPADARLAFAAAIPALALSHYDDLSDPTRHLADLQRAFSRAQDELCDPGTYAAHAKAMPDGDARDRAREVARAYAMYERVLREGGACDFGGLLVHAVALLRDHAEVRSWARETYRHLLVDEYQDVNRASRELLALLAGDGANLWVVGDGRQAIFGWRGASRGAVRDFDRHFPGARTVPLARNYRSRRRVVEAVNALAPQTATVVNRPFVPWEAHRDGEDAPGDVTVARLSDGAAEITYIAERMRALHAAGVPYGEQAVLCRTHTVLGRIATGLAVAGIPVLHTGNPFTRPEVQDMLALVSLACEGDGRGLLRVAAFPEYAVPQTDILALCAAAHAAGVPFPHALDLAADPAAVVLSAGGRAGLRRLWGHLREMDEGDAWVLLARYLFARSAYLAPLLDDATPAGERERAALSQTLDFAHAHGRRATGDNGPLASLLARVRDLAAAHEDHRYGQLPPWAAGVNAVRLLTVHASKGLEFAAVFLPEMHLGTFPHRGKPDPCPPPPGLAGDADADRDADERCLFFVACSRARDVLTLTHTEARHKPSPYLDFLAGVASDHLKEVTR